jgi:hypothetical protein
MKMVHIKIHIHCFVRFLRFGIRRNNMNVLIVDTDKITLDEASQILERCVNKVGTDDWIAIPKGFDIMMNVSVDWMKMIRDKMDEKIREVEGQL